MAVLREEDGEHAGLAVDEALGHEVGVERDVFLGVVIGFGQMAEGCEAEGLGAVERNLDVDHLAVGLQHGGVGRAAFGLLDVHKQVVALDSVFARFQLGQVVVLQEELLLLLVVLLLHLVHFVLQEEVLLVLNLELMELDLVLDQVLFVYNQEVLLLSLVIVL